MLHNSGPGRHQAGTFCSGILHASNARGLRGDLRVPEPSVRSRLQARLKVRGDHGSTANKTNNSFRNLTMQNKLCALPCVTWRRLDVAPRCFYCMRKYRCFMQHFGERPCRQQLITACTRSSCFIATSYQVTRTEAK